MKVKATILLTLLLVTVLTSASVTIHNTKNIQKDYFYEDLLEGEINLTITNEEYIQKITSNNQEQEMELGEYLEDNGISPATMCTPKDCTTNYISEFGDTKITLSTDGEKYSYFGFLLQGQEITVNDINFDISSNFGKEKEPPLKIKFFEREPWAFSAFSNTFSNKMWGCFDENNNEEGPEIKKGIYCEYLTIGETAAIKPGAKIDKGTEDGGELRMTIYPELGGSAIGSCTFNPDQGETECQTPIEVDFQDDDGVFDAGTYRVCISADIPTDHKIRTENTEDTCGFTYAYPWITDKDYGVYIKTVYYDDHTKLSSTDFPKQKMIDQANNILQNRYGNDCTNGCYLPIRVSGVEQALTIENVEVLYGEAGVDRETNKAHKFRVTPARINYEGLIDLELLDFEITKNGIYELFIGNKKILSETLNIIPVPVINGISPINPPAGIQTLFIIAVEYEGNNNILQYEWDMGDGKIRKTTENKINYTYTELNNKTITIKVSAGNLTDEEEFDIQPITPKQAVEEQLNKKEEQLNYVIKQIEKLPTWLQNILKQKIGIEEYTKEIERLTNKRDTATADIAYLEIARDLFQLEVPNNLGSTSELVEGLTTSKTEIDPRPIAEYLGGVNPDYINDYKGPILNWQIQNLDPRISSDIFYVKGSSGSTAELIRVYTLDILSKSDENSYFIIKKPYSKLTFKNNIGAVAQGQVTIIPIEARKRITTGFYYEETTPTIFYASPELNNLVIQAAIDTSCNYNLVCEEGLGEDWKKCRSDCKPTEIVIYLLIGAVIFIILLYLLLAFWYKKRYEKHLFGDKRQLYNLTMYISNARARGIGDGQIRKELERQGWNGERITYAIKKSRGKNTGLPGISNAKKMKPTQEKIINPPKPNTTQPQQQTGRNINKSNFQQPNRR